jgi:hypothetical protein
MSSAAAHRVVDSLTAERRSPPLRSMGPALSPDPPAVTFHAPSSTDAGAGNTGSGTAFTCIVI